MVQLNAFLLYGEKKPKKSADIILIGRDFWDFFLGEGTYGKLLKIFEEAGNEVLK